MMIIKKQTKDKAFYPHIKYDNWKVFTQFAPKGVCTIIHNNDYSLIEIHNFAVVNKLDRGKGNGQKIIAAIRGYFPKAHIWCDTWDHSRPFWEKMRARGYIDSIENDYSWPCFDTSCKLCHPSRANGRRRSGW